METSVRHYKYKSQLSLTNKVDLDSPLWIRVEQVVVRRGSLCREKKFTTVEEIFRRINCCRKIYRLILRCRENIDFVEIIY